MRYWNIARQRHFRSSTRCCWTLRVSVDSAARPSPHTAGNRGFSTYEDEFSRETGSHLTLRWREMDSNFQYAGAVNLLSALLGGLCFAIECGSGRGGSGTARYQRRGWAILAAGVGAARRTARSMKATSSGLAGAMAPDRRDRPQFGLLLQLIAQGGRPWTRS